MTYHKTNGIYYTPKNLTRFLVNKCIDYLKNKKKLRILEPSCGDGRFIKELLLRINKKIELEIDLVEKEKNNLDKIEEIKKISKNFKKIKLNVYNQDYLDFHFQNAKKYDLIIGNPPYIHQKLLGLEQKNLCEKIHSEINSNKKIKNIWTSFLISSMSKIKEDGVICFVLPSEIMQVTYAEELRNRLKKDFDQIEIITFNELIFKGIEQDATTIIAKKKSPKKQIIFTIFENLTDLKKNKIKFKNQIEKKEVKKWNGYILNDNEINLLKKISRNFKKMSDMTFSKVGIVTGANSFFILKKSFVEERGIEKFCKPILQKSSLFNKGIIFDKGDLKSLKKSEKPCYIIDVKGKNNSFEKKMKDYLKKGINEGINKNYKCSIRYPWYAIPSIENSEAFFFKRTHKIPRIVLNKSKILITDGAYRINTKKEFDLKSIIYCFYNSLTLISAELNGRFYGGGVLELTPNEFRDLPIPYLKIKEDLLKKADIYSRKGKFEELIHINDLNILHKKFGVSLKEMGILKEIRKKLRERRLKI